MMHSGMSLSIAKITSAWIALLRDVSGCPLILTYLVKSPVEELCRFKLSCHVGQLKGDCLVFGDRGAKQHDAALCIGFVLLERGLSDAID